MKKILLLVILLLFVHHTAEAQTYFAAFLVPGDERLSSPASSFGYGTFELSKDKSQLHYEVVVWGISDIQAGHFHLASRGVPGNISKHLIFTDKRASVGTWSTSDANEPLTQEMIDSLFAGKMYVNVHTMSNPGGEIRGQLFQPSAYFANASSSQVTVPPLFSGNGAAFLVYDQINATAYLHGQAQSMSTKILGGAIQQGAPGHDGPAVDSTPMLTNAFDSLSAPSKDSTYNLNSNTLQALLDRQLYWNVTTTLHPNGEIRGQFGKTWTNSSDSGMWFMAMLSGAQEGNGFVPSNGTGLASILVNPTRDTLKMQVYWASLSGPVMHGHIHYGWAGEIPNGGANIVEGFTNTGSLLWTASDLQPFTQQNLDNLFAGYYYVNIHTDKFPDGEIRGQIIPLGQPMPLRSAVTNHTVSSGLMLRQNYPNPFAGSTSIEYYLPQEGRAILQVFDPLGKIVATLADSHLTAGDHTATFSAATLPAGVYYVTLSAGGDVRREAVVVK